MKRARPDGAAEAAADAEQQPEAGLRGEFVHATALQATEVQGKGWGVLAAHAVPAGEVLLRARGLRFSAASSTEGERAGSAFLAESLQQLCQLRAGSPADLADADALLRGWRGLCPRPVPAAAKAPLEAQAELLQEMLTHFDGCGVESVEQLIELVVKVECNAFEGGLFPLAAVFNHSCSANCSVALREIEVDEEAAGAQEAGGVQAWVYEVRAMADVAEGDELCLCYLGLASQHLAGYGRKAVLSGWGFECACVRCAPPHGSAWRERDTALVAVPCPACAANRAELEAEDYDAGPWCLQLADDAVGACRACGERPPAGVADGLLQLATSLQNGDTSTEVVGAAYGTTGPRHWLRFTLAETMATNTLKTALALRGDEGEAVAYRTAVTGHVGACKAAAMWAERARCYAPYERGWARLLERYATALRAADGASLSADDLAEWQEGLATIAGESPPAAGWSVAEAAGVVERRAMETMRIGYGGYDSYDQCE